MLLLLLLLLLGQLGRLLCLSGRVMGACLPLRMAVGVSASPTFALVFPVFVLDPVVVMGPRVLLMWFFVPAFVIFYAGGFDVAWLA